jgi:hypothetical protein
MSETKWVFVIDTDQYAGNFEREMCAWLTGVVGECDVGKEMAKVFCEETKFVDEFGDSHFLELLEQRPDDDGHCCRPCSIWINHIKSVAIFFYDRPSNTNIALMKERAASFVEGYKKYSRMKESRKNFKLKILGFHLIKEVKTSTEEEV